MWYKRIGRGGRRLTFAVFLFNVLPKGVIMGKILKTSEEGRKCKFLGCNRVLSIYNHKDYCHVHRNQMSNEHKQEIPHRHLV